MKRQILVVEDEPDLADLVAYNLEQEGFAVSVATSGATALSMARANCPDLVVLDIMLPDITGIDVCRQLRANKATQAVSVIVLTAKGEESDRVAGFEAGADDYVVKPFSPRELLLRVNAVLRRSAAGAEPSTEDVLTFGVLTINMPRHEVAVSGERVDVTPIEFKLLHDLATRRGRVQSRDDLLARVWDYAAGVESRTVDTHVKRLRVKLGAASDYIETVRGIGYRMRDDIE
ncbi:MAG: response regulator transcription factor [Polyangiales bacterium]|nr:response regulator transcription factor [Myxococcales bacterium]